VEDQPSSKQPDEVMMIELQEIENDLKLMMMLNRAVAPITLLKGPWAKAARTATATRAIKDIC